MSNTDSSDVNPDVAVAKHRAKQRKRHKAHQAIGYLHMSLGLLVIYGIWRAELGIPVAKLFGITTPEITQYGTITPNLIGSLSLGAVILLVTIFPFKAILKPVFMPNTDDDAEHDDTSSFWLSTGLYFFGLGIAFLATPAAIVHVQQLTTNVIVAMAISLVVFVAGFGLGASLAGLSRNYR